MTLLTLFEKQLELRIELNTEYGFKAEKPTKSGAVVDSYLQDLVM